MLGMLAVKRNSDAGLPVRASARKRRKPNDENENKPSPLSVAALKDLPATKQVQLKPLPRGCGLVLRDATNVAPSPLVPRELDAAFKEAQKPLAVAVVEKPAPGPAEVKDAAPCEAGVGGQGSELEYLAEILQNLALKQERVAPDFLARHGFTAVNRAVLVDWLMEIHAVCGAAPREPMAATTIYLGVSLFDRFLAKAKPLSLSISVPDLPALEREQRRRSVQLLALTCLFVAAKAEEVYPPTLDDMVRMFFEHTLEDAKARILEWEHQLLTTLQYRIYLPTVYEFVQPLDLPDTPLVSCLSEQERSGVRDLPYYFAERALLVSELAVQPPSEVAALCRRAAQLCAARWLKEPVDATGTEALLQDSAGLLRTKRHQTPATDVKYAFASRLRRALTQQPPSRPAGRVLVR